MPTQAGQFPGNLHYLPGRWHHSPLKQVVPRQKALMPRQPAFLPKQSALTPRVLALLPLDAQPGSQVNNVNRTPSDNSLEDPNPKWVINLSRNL